jgi:hypothetical protein
MRPARLSLMTIAPVFLLAVVLAGYILPPTSRQYLNMATLLIPLIEVAALGMVAWNVRRISQDYRQARQQSVYFLDALEASVRATFGNSLAIRLLTIECVLIFLSVYGWFMSFTPRVGREKAFTYHQKSLYPVIFGVLLFVMTIETIGFHLLIQHWSPLIAWILTIISIYGLFWMIGEFNALRLLPIVIAGDMLYLRSGMRWSVNIPLADIVAIQAPKRGDAKSSGYLSLARAGDPHMVLVLKQPVRVSGIFGLDKEASRIGLFLDDARAFRKALEEHQG